MKTALNRHGTTPQNHSGNATQARTALDDLACAGAQLEEGALRIVAGGDGTAKACGTYCTGSAGTCHGDGDLDFTR